MTQLHFNISSKKIYFASDFHLGTPDQQSSRDREDKIISWLNSIRNDAAAIFLVGDIFDFWFEYKHVVPKGYIRFLGKIAEIKDAGIPVYFFTGNHDMWMFDYFEKELDISVFRQPIEVLVNNQILMLGHGDGLGPGDGFYKFLKLIFTNPILQWVFGWLHPNIGMAIAQTWSKRSRLSNMKKADPFREENEWLWQYCKALEQQSHHDLYIFGHRHLPIDKKLNDQSRYINLGEWVSQFTYLELSSEGAQLKEFEHD
jgi:UDP-2,3-diacylglucosamine hydrolase